MGKYLTADAIFAAEDFNYADVECPEWGGTVRVRSLSGGQRSVITQRVQVKETEELEELLTVMGVVNEDGARIFTNKDIEALKKKSNAPISRIAKKIMEISGIGNADEAVNEAKKNSQQILSDNSSLD
ncbi:MAG: hypothetical protein IJI45_05375 [Anaerolineaceae bacterium]|nr:hypothetical protein [Anaerolineaceae bacterium]